MQLPPIIAHRFSTPAPSLQYQSWRRQFVSERLRLAWWIVLVCFLTTVATNIYVSVFNAPQFDADMAKLYGDAAIGNLARQSIAASSTGITLSLLGCRVMAGARFFQERPMSLFLALSWSITLVEQAIGTWFKIPVPPTSWSLMFLGQALLIPVGWRWHLLAQLVPTAWYLTINPLLGITRIGQRSMYEPYRIGVVINLFWVCLICNLGVYLYERLKQSEFESQWQLKIFLHSISHDLRNPILGSSIVLQNLLKKPDRLLSVDRSILERLQQGSDRQLTLIDALVEARDVEFQGIKLTRSPISLKKITEAALADVAIVLSQHQIQLHDRVSSELPLVWGDAHQLWRVYCNLITNAIKHNPDGITIILDAEPTSDKSSATKARLSRAKWLHCRVKDTGLGIDPTNCQRLFALYGRGDRARYMPGVGLGLYLCQQIIAAHGGEIGVDSQVNGGATFWFTLPIYRPSRN